MLRPSPAQDDSMAYIYLEQTPPSSGTVFDRPHRPMRTVLSRSSSRPARRDLENLFGDAPPQSDTMSGTESVSSQRSAATGTSSPTTTYQHQPQIPTSSPTSPSSGDDDLGHLYSSLPRDAKIGIIVGIVALVSLTLLGCGLCFLDCRRRERRRRERRRGRSAGVVTLETGMRDRQPPPKKPIHQGLWDHLKPTGGNGGNDTFGISMEDIQDARDAERVARQTNFVSVRTDPVAGWSTSQSPRDRASVVSSVPSSKSSVGVKPSLLRDSLEGGPQR